MRRIEWPVPACVTHEILAALPRRFHDSPWDPLFCTDVDGFSLAQLQRRAERHRGPCVLVAAIVPRDAECNDGAAVDGLRPTETVVGAFLSESPAATHGAHKFFGTDETFVFSVPPNRSDAAATARCGMRVHCWTEGNNKEFMLSGPHCLGVGGGKDGAALFLSSDLQRGTSSVQCETFACGPLLSGDTHGLRHIEFATHRLWLFAPSDDYTPMTRVPAELLVSLHDDKSSAGGRSRSNSVRERDVDSDGASLRESVESRPDSFHLAEYVSRHCPAQVQHHRCRFIGEATHRHGADAREAGH